MKPRTKSVRQQSARATSARTSAARPAAALDPWTRVALAGGLVALVLVTYSPLVRAGFIWDDESYVETNETLRSLDGLRRMWSDSSALRQYYPLVHTTFWVEYHIWGLAPLGYHVVNVLLHATNAVLVWQLLARLRVPGALLAAAIFAVHPVEVESVAWVTERKNVLSLALALGSLLAYLQFSPIDEGESAGRNRWPWYALALVLYIGALLSKTVVASLPGALLVMYWWQHGRVGRRALLTLAPFAVFGIALGLFTVALEKHNVGAVGRDWDFSIFQRLLIAGRAAWFYAAKLAWPDPLVFVYPRWTIDGRVWWQYLFPIAALVLLIALWMARSRVGRGPLAAVLVFGGVLVPALGFFNVFPFRYSFVADHFQYHASVALIALAAAGMWLAAEPLTRRGSIAVRVAAGALILLLAGISCRQTFIYRGLEPLYRDTIAKNPNGWMAYSNLGVYVESQGRLDEALELFTKAAELKPDDTTLQSNMGHIYLKLGERHGFKPGQIDTMMHYFRRALELQPSSVPAGRGLGFALYHAKRYDEAIAQFARTLDRKSDDPYSLCGLGAVYSAAGKFNEADRCFNCAIESGENLAEAYRGLSMVRTAQGRADEAIGYMRETLRVDPRHVEAHFELGNLLAQKKNFGEARDEFRLAVKLRPRYIEAWNRLGICYGELGQVDAAIDAFREMARLDPTSSAAQANLEKALELKHKQGQER